MKKTTDAIEDYVNELDANPTTEAVNSGTRNVTEPGDTTTSAQIYGQGSFVQARKVSAAEPGDGTSQRSLGARQPYVMGHDGQLKSVRVRRSPKRARTRQIGDPRPPSPKLYRF